MGADTGKASVRYEKGAIVMDYDSNQQPIFKKIREAFRAAEMETGLKIWAIKKSITVHAWGGACLGPNFPSVASSAITARYTETQVFSSRMRRRYPPPSARLRLSRSRPGLTMLPIAWHK
jgi:hypothetical protein